MTEKTFVRLVSSVLDNYICVLEETVIKKEDDPIKGIKPTAIEKFNNLAASALENKIEETIEGLYYDDENINQFLPVLLYRGFVKVSIDRIGVDGKLLYTVIRIPVNGSMRKNEKLNNHVLINSRVISTTFFRNLKSDEIIEDIIKSIAHMLDSNTPPDAVSNSIV